METQQFSAIVYKDFSVLNRDFTKMVIVLQILLTEKRIFSCNLKAQKRSEKKLKVIWGTHMKLIAENI